MKQILTLRDADANLTFSILYRIEWVETCHSPSRLALLLPFSILYRIEWVETLAPSQRAFCLYSFSILYRIEWVETEGDARHGTMGKPFQYPVSDRMG